MTMPLEARPPGDPAAMLAFAAGLTRRAEELASRGDFLRSRSRATTFVGPAGERFSNFVDAQVRSLVDVAGDLKELANRCRSEAAALQERIESWEAYRDRVLQQRLERSTETGEP